MQIKKLLLSSLLVLTLSATPVLLTGCQSVIDAVGSEVVGEEGEAEDRDFPGGKAKIDVKLAKGDGDIDKSGSYTKKNDVALYLHKYGKLPSNFINKAKAKSLGWKEGESLDSLASGKCIGGDIYLNKDKSLPDNVDYHCCDLETQGKTSRGNLRLVYATDGAIYYSPNNYRSFTQLYKGKE